MNFSNTYLIYPRNKHLERAIKSSIALLGDDMAQAARPDRSVAEADNFLYTRGLFEQHGFSTNVLAPMCDALQAMLAGQGGESGESARAQMQNNLGNILAALGQQRGDAALFQDAARYFNAALDAYDQDQTPLEWAETQYNLGLVNQALGRLCDDARSFKAAIDAYTGALSVWTRDVAAEDWMYAMHQLGSTFHAHGKLLKGNRTFQKSVVAYKNALTVLNADDYALELTATHNNRAVVLHHLAESEKNPARMVEAIKSYDKALTVSMEQQLPVHLSVICRVNKLTARSVLAELSNDTALAEEVADEFEVVIECFSHALQPLCLRHCEEKMNKVRSIAVA